MMILNIFYYGFKYKILFEDLWKYLINNNLSNSLLLIQNGVYWTTELLHNNLSKDIKIYAIKEDLAARGLLDFSSDASNLNHNIIMIDYAKFVELILEHDKSITW